MNEKKIEASLRNFTPLLDSLVKKHGIITAAVWGRMWRYAQQKNGVCYATITKIADELQLSRQSIFNHIKILADNQYILDTTPNLRHSPHTYEITDKALISITIEALDQENPGVNVVDTSVDPGVNVVDTGVNVVDTRCKRRLLKETIETNNKEKISLPKNLPTGIGDLSTNGDWSWLHHELRPLAQAFVQYTSPAMKPSKDERTLWRREVSKWQEFNASPSQIKQAVRKLQKDNLTIGGPTAITKTLRSIITISEKQEDEHPLYQSNRRPNE